MVESLISIILSPFIYIFAMCRRAWSLPCIALTKAVCNESNERCNVLQVYPTPPYANTSVNIRPLPIFLFFFWIFALLQCCIFSYTQLNLLCKIILFIIISIFMFYVDAFLFRLLLFPFDYLNKQREWGVRCAHSFFMLLSFYVFWIRHFSFIYIGYV